MTELENFNKCLASSGEQTLKMTNLLTSFETRLSGLSDLIMPVYLSTNDLKVKFTSMSHKYLKENRNCFNILNHSNRY